MNGPQHYAEAERLLARAFEAKGDSFRHADVYAAMAQAHATLALAAAQLENVLPGTVADTAAKWQDAIT